MSCHIKRTDVAYVLEPDTVTRSMVLEPDTVARFLVFVAMIDAYSISSYPL
jgi:hypothetical protein